MREPQPMPAQCEALSDADAIVMAVYQRLTAAQRPHLLNLIRGLTDDNWPMVERSMVALNVEHHMPTVRAVMKTEG